MHFLIAAIFYMIFIPVEINSEEAMWFSMHSHHFSAEDNQPDTLADFEKFRMRLESEYAEKANKIADHYLKAQRALYRQEYQKAHQEIDKALKIHRNADLLALKGSIYFSAGDLVQAKKYWEEALKLDETLPLPHINGLKKWLHDSGLLP